MGGDLEVHITDQDEIGAVVVDDTYVFWRDIAKQSIFRATK